MSWDFRELDTGTDEHASYALSGELIILYVAELKPLLMTAIQRKTSIDIDLSAITEIDGAGAQLLLFAKKEAQRQDCDLVFSRHSGPVLDLMDLFNLGQDFGDPVLITTAGDR